MLGLRGLWIISGKLDTITGSALAEKASHFSLPASHFPPLPTTLSKKNCFNAELAYLSIESKRFSP